MDYYSFKNTVNYFLSSKVIQLEDSKKDKYLDQLEYDRTSILRDFKVLEKIRTWLAFNTWENNVSIL